MLIKPNGQAALKYDTVITMLLIKMKVCKNFTVTLLHTLILSIQVSALALQTSLPSINLAIACLFSHDLCKSVIFWMQTLFFCSLEI